MKASLVLAAVLPSWAVVMAAKMEHIHHHVHPKPGQAVKFGPNGCIETWRSPVDKCMIATHCKEEDLTNYNVAILCVDNNGQKVRHDFGVDSFDPEETFDTSVLCHRCEAEDAAVTTTSSPTSTAAPPAPVARHEEVGTTTAQSQAPEPVVSQVAEAAQQAAPVALAAAAQDPKDPTWNAVAQLSETIKAMKDEMKQVSAVVETMNNKVFPDKSAQPATAAQPAPSTLPAKFLAARPAAAEQLVDAEQVEQPEPVAQQKASHQTPHGARRHKHAHKAKKAPKHHHAVAQKTNHAHHHLAAHAKKHLKANTKKHIATHAKKHGAAHAKKHRAVHGKKHLAKKQRRHGKHHVAHHAAHQHKLYSVHLEKAVEPEQEVTTIMATTTLPPQTSTAVLDTADVARRANIEAMEEQEITDNKERTLSADGDNEEDAPPDTPVEDQ